MQAAWSLLPIVLSLAAATEALAQAPAVAAPTAATVTDSGQASPVHIEAKLSTVTPLFGERLEYRVTLRYPSGYRVFFPTKPDLRPLLVDTRDPGKSERQEVSGQVTEIIAIPALAVRSGALKTPAIEVPWQAPATGAGATSGTLTVPPLRLTVKSQFAGDTQFSVSPLPPARPLIEENTPLELGLLVLAMMLLSALMTAVGLKVYRDRAARRAPKIKVPAHVIALQRLEEFDRSERPETGQPSDIFAELSEILRQYLGARYRFAAIDMTTTELLAKLKEIEVRGIAHEELASFADLSDLVKFARVPASAEELRKESAFVRRVVERTMLSPAEQEAARRAEAERLARQRRMRLQVMAPGPLRLRAFAIDLLMGSLAAALVGWVAIDTGKKLLFDISYLLVPVWLIIRDALSRQSPGKTMIGLQIARHEDEPPVDLDAHAGAFGEEETPTAELASVGARLWRNILFAVPLAGLIAEAVTCLYLPEMRRMGDQFAATRVIDARYGTRRGASGWVPAVLLLALAAMLLTLPWMMGGRPA